LTRSWLKPIVKVSILSLLTYSTAVVVFEIGVRSSLPVDLPIISLSANVFSLQVIGMGTAAIGFFWVIQRDWRNFLNITWPDDEDANAIVWTLSFLFGSLLVLYALSTLLGIAPNSSDLAEPASLRYYVVAIGITLFIVGPMEELFFRGIIQGYLAEQTNTTVAILTASVLFSLFHIEPSTIGGARALIPSLMLLVVGIILGWSFVWTRNLAVPMVAHGLFNAIQFALRIVELVL